MADLDDFFAKKDKKKSKGKKFLTPDEVVKTLEDTSKREVAVKPKPVLASAPTPTPPATSSSVASADEPKPKVEVEQQHTEEEWKEFEEEQRKDYTGLKIGQLTLSDEDELSPGDGDDDDVDNYVHTGNEGGGNRNDPWKKVIPAEEVTQIPMEVEKQSSKLYISPALRQSQLLQAGSRLKTRNRNAPDITNADFFPTLGAARPEEQRKKKNEPAFEEVRHGGRIQRASEPTAAPASIVNRFQSLDEDDS